MLFYFDLIISHTLTSFKLYKHFTVFLSSFTYSFQVVLLMFIVVV